MPLPFKHQYIFEDEITREGIYYVNAKISYKDKHIFNKFVFCKIHIDYFESGIVQSGLLKPLGIKQNLNSIVTIRISVIKHLGNTTTK